jgi:hypothetical protein
MLTSLRPLVVPGQEDTLALAACFRLYNKSFCFPIVELFFKRLEIGRKDPCLWKEFVVFWEELLHC